MRAASLLLDDSAGQLRSCNSLLCKLLSAVLLMASTKLSLALMLCKAISTAETTLAS